MIYPVFVELKDDVIEFFNNQGTIMYERGVKSFIVNNAAYTETRKKNIYTVTFKE
jgi:hypothetical protein